MAQTNQDLRDKLQTTDPALQQPTEPPLALFFDQYERGVSLLLEGTGVTYGRLKALLLESALEQPRLLECLKTPHGRASLISSMRKVASLGFEPGGHLGQCWVLPGWDGRDKCYKAHLEIGAQGYKDLMYASGLVSVFHSERIYTNDVVTYIIGSGEHDQIRIERDLRAEDLGEPFAYYLKIRMVDGGEYVIMRNRQQINQGHQQFTRSRDRQGNIVGPWVTHYDAMALKSLIIEARKDLPRKVERAITEGVVVESSEDTLELPLLEAQTAIEVTTTNKPTDDEEQSHSDFGRNFDNEDSTLVDLAQHLWDSALTGVGEIAEQRRQQRLRAMFTALGGGRNDVSVDTLVGALRVVPLAEQGALPALLTHLVDISQTIPDEHTTDRDIQQWLSTEAQRWRAQHTSQEA